MAETAKLAFPSDQLPLALPKALAEVAALAANFEAPPKPAPLQKLETQPNQ